MRKLALRLCAVALLYFAGGAALADSHSVRVYFLTDCQPATVKNVQTFRGARSTLHFGYCDVDVPQKVLDLESRLGAVKQQRATTNSRFRSKLENDHLRNNANNVSGKLIDVWKDVKREDYKPLDVDLNGFVAKVLDLGKPVCVYVHGFNNSWESSLRHAARLAHTVEREGHSATIVLYSWPSVAHQTDYTYDLCNAEWATEDYIRMVDAFRTAIAARPLAKDFTFSLVAHSLGNQLLTRALAYEPTGSSASDANFRPIDQVVMCSPDVDLLFADAVRKRMETNAKRITIFTSNADWPLVLSRIINGQPRLGRPEAAPKFLAVMAPFVPRCFLTFYPELSSKLKQLKSVAVAPADVALSASGWNGPKQAVKTVERLKEKIIGGDEHKIIAVPKVDPQLELIDFTALDLATRQGHNVQWDLVASLLAGNNVEDALIYPYRFTWALQAPDVPGASDYWVRRITPFPALVASGAPLTPVIVADDPADLPIVPNCHCSVSDNRFTVRFENGKWQLDSKNAPAGQWHLGIRCTKNGLADFADAIVTVH